MRVSADHDGNSYAETFFIHRATRFVLADCGQLPSLDSRLCDGLGRLVRHKRIATPQCTEARM